EPANGPRASSHENVDAHRKNPFDLDQRAPTPRLCDLDQSWQGGAVVRCARTARCPRRDARVQPFSDNPAEGSMSWSQAYDPFGNAYISTIMASLPILVLLGSLAFFHVKAHWAAILGLLVARSEERRA